MAKFKIGYVNVEIKADVCGHDFTDEILGEIQTAFTVNVVWLTDHNNEGYLDDVIAHDKAVIEAIRKARGTK